MTVDMVNNPPHYQHIYSWLPGQCQDYRRHMTPPQSDAFKYAWRAGHKTATLEDWGKCLWYIEDALRHGLYVPVPASKVERHPLPRGVSTQELVLFNLLEARLQYSYGFVSNIIWDMEENS